MSNNPTHNPVRRVLLWWFGAPSVPWITVNVLLDAEPALAWLERVGREGGAGKLSWNVLLAGAVARVLTEFPQANAKVVGRRIVRYQDVGMAMPVNLLGHAGEKKGEVGLIVVPKANRGSLRDIAAATRRDAEKERTGPGRSGSPFVKGLVQMASHAPEGLFYGGLDLLDAVARRSQSPLLDRVIPITTAISNPGAGFGEMPGRWFRGGAAQLPTRLVQIGTFFGVAPIQPEVLVIDGAPAVRRALPVMFLFDHRLFDGVMAGKILARLGEILRDPGVVFGDDGARNIDSR